MRKSHRYGGFFTSCENGFIFQIKCELHNVTFMSPMTTLFSMFFSYKNNVYKFL